jgi:hypothetical protein
VNVDIAPFLTYIRNNENGFFASATVFALSSTKGEYISAQILVENQTLIGNIPISALTNNKETIKLDDKDCVYCACPSDNFIINCYEHLNSISICSILKSDNNQCGTYILTCEWENKLQLHFIELEDGNYIFWPNDKIVWNND